MNSMVRAGAAVLTGMGLALAMVSALPASQAANTIHVTVAGDYGARSATNTVLTEIAHRAPDLHLAVGDLAYGDVATEAAWCDFVKARVGEGFPFQLISGNHESDDVGDGQINDFSACLPNQIPGAVGTYGREYYVDYPRGNAPLARFIQVSPGLTFEGVKWTYSVGDAHYRWLSNAIDDARSDGIPWVVVSSHYPCVSVGTNGCVAGRSVYDLLLEKKVDLVLHGHEHAYMRTHQLRAGAAGCDSLAVGSADPDCIADSDNAFTSGRGTVFATAGTGGTPLRDINAADPESAYFAAVEGANTTATYGLLDLTMTDTELNAAFVGTSGGAFSDSFTVSKGADNQSPTADFSATANGRAVTFDGAASTDPDGSIASYSWNFGDGSAPEAGSTAAHTYAADGTYAVTLTVTDDVGATATRTKNVVVSNPSVDFAVDSFSRSIASGWGTANTGGSWTTAGAAGSTWVNGVVGQLRMGGGQTVSAFLGSVQQPSVDLRATLVLDKAMTGGGVYTSLVARRVSAGNDYRLKVRYLATGEVQGSLVRVVNGAETTLASGKIAGLVQTPGLAVNVRVMAKGTGPTTLSAKLWPRDAAEPASWNLQASDAAAVLQASGSIGVVSYLSSTATNAPVVQSVDDLRATAP